MVGDSTLLAGVGALLVVSALLLLRQKRTQRALTQSRDEMRLLLDTLPVGVWFTDATGKIIGSNPKALEIWGGRREVGIDRYGEYVAWWPDTGKQIEAHEWGAARALLKGETSLGELVEIQPFDGSAHKFMLNSAAPIRKASGEVIGAIVTNEDITGQVLADRARREADNRYRAFFERLTLATAQVCPSTGRFLDVNDAFCALIGYTREELLAKATADITHPADRLRDKEEYGRLLRGEITAYTREKRYIHKNGNEIWVHLDIGAVRQSDGAPLYTIGVIQDITERRRVEEKARKRATRMAILAKAAGDLLNVDDPNQYLASLYQRVGLELDLDAYFHFAVTEDQSRLTLQSFGGVTPQAAGQIRQIEFGQGIAGAAAMKRRMIVVEDIADGRDPRASFLAFNGMKAAVGFPLIHGSRVTGALSFATRLRRKFEADDLDLLRALADYVAAALERDRLLHELERRNTDLQRSNTDLEQFACSVSHDLQEPLRAIASFSDLLARRYKGKLDSDADEFIDYINSGAERMRAMIRGILTYSRARRHDRFAREPVDLNRVAKWALENLQGSIEESGAQIDCGRLPAVAGDFAQLVTVMQNLIGNAIKYRNGSKPHVSVSAMREGSQWVISVQDNGRGIDPQDHERIFDLFNRLRSSGDRTGSGIGLAICRKIVEQSGGRMWVESESGSGAKFSFTVTAA